MIHFIELPSDNVNNYYPNFFFTVITSVMQAEIYWTFNSTMKALGLHEDFIVTRSKA